MQQAPPVHDRIFSDENAAKDYARRHRQMGERLGRQCATRLAARGFKAGRIIDVGCGPGATCVSLAQAFSESEVLGVDLSEPLLRLAREAADAAQLGERVRFERADVQQMPYADRSFDVVINLNMVHVVDDPVHMLDEMERVLSPGGALFIADLKRSWLALLEKEMRAALTLQEAKQLLARSRVREGAYTSDLIFWRFEA